MKTYIYLLMLLLSSFINAKSANTIDCIGAELETLDLENSKNIRKLATVGSQNRGGIYTSYNYPKLPSNIEDILKPDLRTVCDFYAKANPTDPFFKDIRENITKNYKDGDDTDFFFKYMLTLPCWHYSKNMFDYFTGAEDTRNGIGLMFGDIMKPLFDGADPNAFIRIWREGEMFEGPMYIVYDHLLKHYSKSERFRSEYLPIVKRLRHPRYITKFPKKTLEQIKKEEPDMPITLPMPEK
ncbi:hypothetical protein BALOs_1937 [Halobacteriovorax sp. BALOs_7]|uniref:hypothetical protein n=1 Tax=Halobacteriovorax sp. BALOs_7 TaxID=2109558 RepID=UPI000EA0CA72|nr:hypothetical protein [Halobacteriovorax sp. BALOs_7]AYF44936.1 hypothetical protein BALOs_1937 [Halobacteriovorax sp. BALOs_7]